MNRRHESHWLPYTVEQMFDLAADIERYPEFLPQWSQARILRQENDVLHVEQELDIGIHRLRFQSRAVLHRPVRLHISSDAAMFRQMKIEWHFASGTECGCQATLAVEMEMRSMLLDAVAGRIVSSLTRDTFNRFIDRAALLYPV